MSTTKYCGNVVVYFLTNMQQAKAFFLYQFGKVITLIYNDWKAKLDSEREQCTVNSFFINFLIK